VAAKVAQVNDQVLHFAALLCSHKPEVTFAEAQETAIDVLVDVEIPLAIRTVMADALNVREFPSLSPEVKITHSIASGQVVEVWCDRDDGWSFVVWDDNGGWCSTEYLGAAPPIE